MRFLHVFLIALFVTLAAPAFAQIPSIAEQAAIATAEPAKPAPPAAPQLDDDQKKLIIRTLEDPQSRADFLKKLKAFDAATAADATKKPPSASLQVLGTIDKAFESGAANFSEMMRGFANMSQITGWFTAQFQDPASRAHLLGFVLRVVLALAAGFAAYFTLYLGLRPTRKRLGNVQGESLVSRLGVFFIYHLFTLLPPLGFTLAALMTAASFDVPAQSDQALSAILSAFIVLQITSWIVRMLFAPAAPQLRFIPLNDENAAYLSVWSTRFAAMIVFGFFMVRAAAALGATQPVLHAFIACIGFVVVSMAIILVLQNREAVASWIRGIPKPVDPEKKEEEKSFLASTRARLADIWHILAIGYLCMGFIIAAFDPEHGFHTLARATVVTVVTLAIIHLLLSGVGRVVEEGFALPKELKREFPGLEERTNSYLPIFERIIKAIAWFAGGVLILGAWGFDTVAWFTRPEGQAFLSAAAAIALTIFITVVLWELVSNLIEHVLEGRDARGHRMVRSARVRTLLPLLRIGLHILLIIGATLIVLSPRMGLDITPLLAGAGIVGLAIGFGAQTLVKDFITGLFILMEDTISLGDIVEVSGHSGVVEAMTIRTLRLRDINGHVHSLPFSEVTTVVNKTRHFAYVVIDVSVGYDADAEKVMRVMKETAETLRQDPATKNVIYDSMEMMGVDQYAASGIVVRGRIKVNPLEQWSLRRKYLLLLKQAFGKAGVTTPIPVVAQTRYAPEDVAILPPPEGTAKADGQTEQKKS